MSAEVMSKSVDSFTVDLDKLLAPISIERPSGEWLRYAGTYDAIEDARREDDTNLPRGVWQHDLKRADWAKVATLCQEALETRTKDLQLAVWLLEAWIHLHGFSGVEEGLKLLSGLSESFWDDLHPQIDEGDLESRTAPLRWMNEKLPEKLRRIPITRPETGESSYSFADWDGALHLANLARTDAAAAHALEEKGRVSQAKFQVGVSLTRSTFYIGLAERIRQSREGTDELSRFYEAKCGAGAPSLSQFRATLDSVGALVANVIRERMEDKEGEVTGEPSAESRSDHLEVEGTEAEPSYTGGAIKSRAEAYRRLSEAAEYLMRVEPHSPAPYLVKRAVAWGGMPLAELLEELLRDNADSKTVHKLLGLKDRG